MIEMDFWQGLTTILEKYGIETLAILVLLIIVLRSAPSVLKAISEVIQTWVKARAEAKQLKARADADERSADSAAMSALIKLVEKQTDLGDRQTAAFEDLSSASHQSNRILDEYKSEFRQSRLTTERIEAALKEFNTETRALRLDLKAWPNTVDGTLAGAITAIETMRLSNEKEHGEVLRLVREMHEQVGVMYKLVMRPTPEPPPLPHDQTPNGNVTPLHADAARANAELPKASGE